MRWQWLILVFLFLGGMGLYLPTIYLRKANRILELLEAIERNTRQALGPQSIARFIIRGVISDGE